ncbi:hypothetical protein [Vibrio salinus]|uniref:hypothetical protein n=1 Tax=Vibrio salinus TaxID=2899784 RepID=UPI001E3D2FC1|nr:hypothetical protein [Vibrio salinus]MCE0494664.1 hypothetical protein [Vibrio salinus]
MTMAAQQAFDRLVTNDFRHASIDDVKIVAIAIWHEDFIPDVNDLDSVDSAKAACYVIDKLMRFNCVDGEQQKKLINVLNSVSRRFELIPLLDLERNQGLDLLARKWGLKSDLKLMTRKLLYYQTRHYKHTPLHIKAKRIPGRYKDQVSIPSDFDDEFDIFKDMIEFDPE